MCWGAVGEQAGPDQGQGTLLVFFNSGFVSLASISHGTKLMVRVVLLSPVIQSPDSEPPCYITLTHQASIPPALNQRRAGDQPTGDSPSAPGVLEFFKPGGPELFTCSALLRPRLLPQLLLLSPERLLVCP